LKKQTVNPTPPRPIANYFKQYVQAYPPGRGRTLQIVSAYIMLLGLLGIFWAMPFPNLRWLGSYNGFINWASVFMAVVVYAYYRLSPVLSYLILMVMFAFTYGISQSQVWQKAGGPELASVSGMVLFAALILWLISCKLTTRQELVAGYVKMLFIAPLWPLHLLFGKQGKY